MRADGVLAGKDSLERNAPASALRRLRAACEKASAGTGLTVRYCKLRPQKEFPAITGGEFIIYAAKSDGAAKLLMAWDSVQDAFVESAHQSRMSDVTSREHIKHCDSGMPGLLSAFDEIEAELKPLRSGSFGELAIRLETCA